MGDDIAQHPLGAKQRQILIPIDVLNAALEKIEGFIKDPENDAKKALARINAQILRDHIVPEGHDQLHRLIVSGRATLSEFDAIYKKMTHVWPKTWRLQFERDLNAIDYRS